MSQLFVGVDGGGSRTRALVCADSGEELASADGEGSALRGPGIDRSVARIAAVVREAVTAAGGSTDDVRALCAGVAGTGRDLDRDGLETSLERLRLGATVIVVPDATIALEDAFADGPGILLTSGTGSIALGRGPTGVLSRCGGWGPVCGDEGSGAWLGRKALGVVTSSHDGREPETALTHPLLTAAGVGAVEDLVNWAAAAEPADLALLAPVVLEVAATGDLRANSLIALAIEELGMHVRTIARRLFADERAAFPLALSGGLLTAGGLLRRRLEQRFRSFTPGAQLYAGEVRPERGAVRYALRHVRTPAAAARDA